MPISKVLDLKAFVPARDFELSRRFYLDLGFRQNWGDSQICELGIEGFRFLLQEFYVKEHAGNFMMHLMVEDADEWWVHINELGLVQKYELSLWPGRRNSSRGACGCSTWPIPAACCGISPIGKRTSRPGKSGAGALMVS